MKLLFFKLDPAQVAGLAGCGGRRGGFKGSGGPERLGCSGPLGAAAPVLNPLFNIFDLVYLFNIFNILFNIFSYYIYLICLFVILTQNTYAFKLFCYIYRIYMYIYIYIRYIYLVFSEII